MRASGSTTFPCCVPTLPPAVSPYPYSPVFAFQPISSLASCPLPHRIRPPEQTADVPVRSSLPHQMAASSRYAQGLTAFSIERLDYPILAPENPFASNGSGRAPKPCLDESTTELLESVDNVIIGPQNRRREIPLRGISPVTTAGTLSRNREDQHLTALLYRKPCNRPADRGSTSEYQRRCMILCRT